MATKEQIQQEQQKVLEELNKRYVYVLAAKCEPRGMVYDAKTNQPIPDREYPRTRNLLFASSIIWEGGEDPFSGKERKAGAYPTRYYDGCTTLFVDDQPKDRETIEQLMVRTRDRLFVDGYLETYGYETMLRAYLDDYCSWNEENPRRITTREIILKRLDAEKEREYEDERINLVEEALTKAKNAKTKRMMIHARFLGIPMMDFRTSQPLSEKSIRTEYRKAAIQNPREFLRTYNDDSLHLQAWIEKAIETGEISTSVIPNRASWAKKGVEITDISGLKSREAQLNKLIEFAKSAEGKEFAEQLAALYDK